MRILLAVSGGIDSMYLANRAPELFPGARFAVAHCNFTLRGAESDGDEAFVRDWCAAHALDCFVQRFDTAAYATEHGVSIEMAARELRYAWFARLCREKGFDAVAVAHNADDNAETMLLNLLRGTGTRGLRGMGEHDGIVRPENAAYLAGLFPQASVTLVPGTEHALPIFIPGLIDKVVEEMIDDRG